jgi:hypothetical protein
MSSQVAHCLRQIGSGISSVFVDSVLDDLGVRSREEMVLSNCFVRKVDDDEPCSYRKKLGEETFYDLHPNQSSSHSKVLSKTHKDPLPTLQSSDLLELHQSECQNV